MGAFGGDGKTEWRTVESDGRPTARHEAAFVAAGDRLLLIGGRRVNPVDVFDPAARTWRRGRETPIELHHFQAVELDGLVYLIGAMTGPWPNETPVDRVVVYDPAKDDFRFTHFIPADRRRGGAGAVAYDGAIYLIGGITNGHMNGSVGWLDRYEPETGRWEPLPDAPRARDHFQAIVHGDRLFAVAGRTTSQATDQGFDLTIPEVDVFDLSTRRWLPVGTVPDLPTPRAGNMAAVFGDHLVVGGGESGTQVPAHSEVEAIRLPIDERSKWVRWPDLKRGRHGSGFAIVDGAMYTASGSGDRGGGPELESVEALASVPTVATSSSAGHPITLDFRGPATSENAGDNPFTDVRLSVVFDDGKRSMTVRGFYAADGDAANTGADAGDVWRVRFTPPTPGTWRYAASMRIGDDVALSDDPDAGDAYELDNNPVQANASEGAVLVGDAVVDGAYGGGTLDVEDGLYVVGPDRRRWFKSGTNSPENLLAYADFDATRRLPAKARDGEARPPGKVHRFQPQADDFRPGDPTWAGGRGKNLIGAVNYLSDAGVNSVYFLTMNLDGDGRDVWPHADVDDFTRFDCSKLDQWEIVFTHMQRRGVAMHVVTQETENELLLDGGDVGRHRRLYYDELIARFGHHPMLVWDLGEENGPANFSPEGQTPRQRRAMADHFARRDPYRHPVIVHTHAATKAREDTLPPLLGHGTLDGISLQVDAPERVREVVTDWRRRSERAGRRWAITMDEIGRYDVGAVPDGVDPSHDVLRRRVLWGSMMAGAAGVEWYFGYRHPHNDLNAEDFRSREELWRQSAIARRFFERHAAATTWVPADDRMVRDAASPAGGGESEADDGDSHRFDGGMAMTDPGRGFVVYCVEGIFPRLDLTGVDGEYTVGWFDPLVGDEPVAGTVPTVRGGGRVDVGRPPVETRSPRDWVVLLERL